MALTPDERRRMHNRFEQLAGNHLHNYTKPQLKRAFDELEAQRIVNEAQLNADVNTATTGINWSVGRFRNLQLAYWYVKNEDSE